MPLNDIFSVEDDNVDRIVRVEFSQTPNNRNLLTGLQTMTDVLRRGANANRFEELIALKITPEFCEIRLRYFTEPKRKKLGLTERGYADPVGHWFLQYLFA